MLIEESVRLTDASIRNSLENVEKSPVGTVVKNVLKAPLQISDLAPTPIKALLTPVLKV